MSDITNFYIACSNIAGYQADRPGAVKLEDFQTLAFITDLRSNDELIVLAYLHTHRIIRENSFFVKKDHLTKCMGNPRNLDRIIKKLNGMKVIDLENSKKVYDCKNRLETAFMLRAGQQYFNWTCYWSKSECSMYKCADIEGRLRKGDDFKEKDSEALELMEEFCDQQLNNGPFVSAEETLAAIKLMEDSLSEGKFEIFEQRLSKSVDNPMHDGWFSDYIQSLSKEEKGEVLKMVKDYLENGFNLDRTDIACKSLLHKGIVTAVSMTSANVGEDTIAYLLSNKAARMLLKGFPINNINLISSFATYQPWSEIAEKPLFYNDEIISTIDSIQRVCNKEQYNRICAAMEKKGRAVGITSLLYGGPGTGKTELARQIALKSKRDLIICDYTKLTSSFVGEAPRNAKLLFTAWNLFEAVSENCPILLLNEADSIIHKRVSVTRSWDTEVNAIQNDWLDFFEHFRGIMICTTNCIGNMDEAFDRRFFFKCEVTRPDEANRRKMWQALKPDYISDEMIDRFCKYDLSCANIENIIKRLDVQQLLYDKNPSEEEIMREIMNESDVLAGKKDKRQKVGFSL